MSSPQPKASDRAALTIAILLGVIVIIVTLVQTVIRIIEIAPNVNVPVSAAFADTPAELPIGPDGALVPVVADQVSFTVSGMPPITYVSLLLAAIIPALAIITTIACVCLVIRNLILGRAFTQGNVGLVGIGTIAVAVGFLLTWLFSTMGMNGAATALAGAPGENSTVPIEPIWVFAIAALGAAVVAFQSGRRLERETAGLV